ncbi:hypothetical protein QG37_02787 [Candidozyma auris]|nr:hypothetical protein QG37_02787 [[Candida] auris]
MDLWVRMARHYEDMRVIRIKIEKSNSKKREGGDGFFMASWVCKRR